MSDERHRTLRESLGVYAIGGLDAAASASVRAHLDGCAECRAELEEVRSPLGALRRVDPRALDETPTPPADLGDRIVARVRDEALVARGGHRRSGLLVAAAAVVVALAAAGAGYAVGVAPAADPGEGAMPGEALAVRSEAPGVRAAASAIPHTWGVEITLDGGGFAPGAVYRVVVVDDAGRAVDAGQFLGTGSTAMRCNLNSSVLRADATGFDVLDDGGAVVVHGDL